MVACYRQRISKIATERYVVLDGADSMMDMSLEPQIVVGNSVIRPRTVVPALLQDSLCWTIGTRTEQHAIARRTCRFLF
uniref:Uncharacterized protein n=1 Tax=Arundo donax TaxID=35708 RepID=A0A0A9H6F0_ARUDO